MMSIVSMGVVTMTWVILGFSIAFGENGPVIGNADYALFMNLDMAPWGESGLPGLCFACFQMTFAIIASAIISGSLVERMRFSAYVVLIALWSLVIYAPLCHWVWGPGGWIEELGAKDFAGGTVVHISSGVSGFVASGLVGPRRHAEKEPTFGTCSLAYAANGFKSNSARIHGHKFPVISSGTLMTQSIGVGSGQRALRDPRRLPAVVRLAGLQRGLGPGGHGWRGLEGCGHHADCGGIVHADLDRSTDS